MKLLLCVLFVFLFASSLFAAEITVSSFTKSDWRYGGRTAKLRLYLSDRIITSDGTMLMPASIGKTEWYKEITCAVTIKTVSCPSFTVDSTIDSSVPDASYTFVWWSVGDSEVRRDILGSIKIPASPTTTTVVALIDYNKSAIAVNPEATYSKAEIAAISGELETMPIVSELKKERARLDVAATSSSDSAAGANSSRVQKSLSLDYGNDIITAISNIGQTKTELLITADTSISAPVVIPPTLKIVQRNGARFVRSGAGTLTIGSVLDAPPIEIFSGFTNGNLVLNGALTEIYPQWFGAIGDGVTDDTAAFQMAIDVAKISGKGRTVKVPNPPIYYNLTGTLNLNQARNVIIEGSNQPLSNAGGLTGGIIFSGSGANARISARSSSGVKFRNLKINYTSDTMTGYLIDYSRDPSFGDTHYPAIENCELGGYGKAVNAAALVYLKQAIIGHISDTLFTRGQIGILGGSPYSNAFYIKGNTFWLNVVDHIRNGHTNWTIEDNTFESLLDGRAGGYSETIISYGNISIRNNYFGDVTKPGGYFLSLMGHHFVIENNNFTSTADDYAVNLNPTKSQIETVVLRDNVYTRTKNAVLITGNSYVRRLSFDNETFLPHGATAPTFVMIGSGSLAPLSVEYHRMDYEGQKTTFPSLKLSKVVDFMNSSGETAYQASDLPLISRLGGGSAPPFGFPYSTLALFGATRKDGIVNPISFLTGETTPTEKLRIDSNIVAKASFRFNADNTYDIGESSSAWRPRNIYAGTSMQTPSLTVGSGTPVTKILSAAASLDFTALAANSCEERDITGFSGLTDGDVVSLGLPIALTSNKGAVTNTNFNGFVKNATTVTVRRCNVGTTVSFDPSAAVVRAMVLKF